MATSFPTSKDNLSNPSANDELTGHAAQHTNANDAIEALETVVGVTGSTDSGSITYKVNLINDTLVSMANATDAISTLFGLEGNNDLTVNGIENKTTIDSFQASNYRTATYALQISRGTEYYFSNITALHDSTNIYVSESDIVSNTNSSLATVLFEQSNGIISLTVTPVSTAVTARYFRTALK
jgi:hypothetical protein